MWARESHALVMLLLTALPIAGAYGAQRARAARTGETEGEHAERTDSSPLNKVTAMLEDMLAKGKMAKHAEEADFAEFKGWCDHTRDITTKTLSAADSSIEQLQADIAKAQADAEDLAEDLEDLNAGIQHKTNDAQNATTIRKKEEKDYLVAIQDLSDSIDATDKAIKVVKAKSADVAHTLVQVQDSPQLPVQAKHLIETFIEFHEEAGLTSRGSLLDGLGSPEAKAYEFQSGGIVNLLQKLLRKFQDEKLVLEKEESSARHNYELLIQQLTEDLKVESSSVTAKTTAKARRLQDASAAKAELEGTLASKADAEKKLRETLAECRRKSEEFEKNQVLRTEEIKAIKSALDILHSDAVSGTATASLIQRSMAHSTSLVQLRAESVDTSEDSKLRYKVAMILQEGARQTGSRYLSLIAAHVTIDPFAKVKTMIKALITKLMDEARAEADHEAYCSSELSTNKLTRSTKQSEVEELTANIEQKSADSSQASTKLQELSNLIAELRKEQESLTKIRKAEASKNGKTIAEAKEAQAAVQKATQVLKDFFNKAADQASLVQTDADEEMSQAAETPYTGMQSQSDGVIGFLEVILSDFARLETQTSYAEEESQQDYEQFMSESTQDIEVKQTEISHLQDNKQMLDATIQDLKKELKLTQLELEAAVAYDEKLKSECGDAGLQYEDRVSKRAAEIQKLKEALEILDQHA